MAPTSTHTLSRRQMGVLRWTELAVNPRLSAAHWSRCGRSPRDCANCASGPAEHFEYEPGMRSGAWMKMRVNRGQEFVVGGYTIGTKTLVFGVYEGKESSHIARRHARPPQEVEQAPRYGVLRRDPRTLPAMVTIAAIPVRAISCATTASSKSDAPLLYPNAIYGRRSGPENRVSRYAAIWAALNELLPNADTFMCSTSMPWAARK